jgi:hypothetical protein
MSVSLGFVETSAVTSSTCLADVPMLVSSTAHRLLASLGQLLLFSPHFDTALSPILEALEAKRIVQSKRGILEKNAEAMKLVGEISSLVEST